MIRAKTVVSFLMFGLSGATPAWARLSSPGAANRLGVRASIRRDISPDQKVNKVQAERLPLEACLSMMSIWASGKEQSGPGSQSTKLLHLPDNKEISTVAESLWAKRSNAYLDLLSKDRPL